MTIKSISFHKTFNLGNYSSEKIGVEIDIEIKDDVQSAIDFGRKLVEQNHKQNNPELYPKPVIQKPYVPQEIPNINYREQSAVDSLPIEDQIRACTKLEGSDGLLSFKFPSRISESAKAAYDEMMEKLKS